MLGLHFYLGCSQKDLGSAVCSFFH
jgi:hypothetical protein